MIRSSFVSYKATPVALAVLLLAGCGSVDGMFSTDKVDYRGQAKQTGGLDVPPDLTQLAKDNRSQVQGGVISASALQQGGAAAKAAALPTVGTSVALNAAGDARLERNGSERWVRTSMPPDQLWPLMRAFWQERGFEIVKESAETGVMEPNWNENRAKLPQDIIRSTIGKVFDGLYSTGERDMFRSRVERLPAGGSEIFISHKGMQEVYTTGQRDQTAWQPRPNDPMLEAEMLSRLMLKLGAKDEDAKAALLAANTANATKPATASNAVGMTEPAAPRAARSLADVPDSLTVAEGFERAWRRVGQSLDRHGFTIEDRDRTQGIFFLRYADPNQAGKEEPNFFQRLFSKDAAPAQVRYRVKVSSVGERSTVMVLDDKGQQQTGDIGKRILNLLMDDLR